MNVAAVQFKATKGDYDASLSRLTPLLEQACPGADLVVLPEMALTGYLFDSPAAARRVAEPADGPTFHALSAFARRHGTWLVAGFPEAHGASLFNSALVIDRTGALVHVYRKTLLYEADVLWASPGGGDYRVFDTGSGTFTVGICMDLNDPEFVDWCEQTRPRAIAFPTNWIDEGLEIWGYWAACIFYTRSALVAADSYGPEGDTQFWGRSAILDGPARPREGAAATLRASGPVAGDAVVLARLPARKSLGR